MPLPFTAGANTSFTNINNTSLNKTALLEYNYTLYPNATISNSTHCYLVFSTFKPTFLSNGTWLNATTCYIPYYPIATRGILSIGYGVLFGLTIVLTMMNLRKHGKRYLRESKRFRAVGRRWQWYWMLSVAGCGIISTLTGVDIDRYYLQDLPIILQSFFFALMVPGTLAMVWEGTRHWASWQVRQICDEDPFLLPQHDRRAKTEFWLPLVFYVFAFLDFFMVIPRSWSGLKKQNTEWQIEHIARPAATGARDKAGAILAVCAWMVICYSLWHSLKHYKQESWKHCPPKLAISIVVLAARLGYGMASAWNWDISISKVGVQLGWPFGLGYAAILVIILILEIAGFLEENEDKVLIAQRTARGRVHDTELNITRKPSWWQKNFKDRYLSDEQRHKNMTAEIGGGRATSQRIEQDLEMRSLTVTNLEAGTALEDPFRDEPLATPLQTRQMETASSHTNMSDAASMHSSSSERSHARQPPQQHIRSMLDI
ncbi:hypothetical protein CC86DRAFT_369697 [Ophiobolus disseminans]|uniref:Uncharacterized protein n=1 Tax=Ophiobolus disseminans TaxID=1469910 RepID=A0A6A7A3A0_9PLEO|nr:hypothetical protein CC86DRAFT_369697 [Ophiobolus disseminans]